MDLSGAPDLGHIKQLIVNSRLDAILQNDVRERRLNACVPAGYRLTTAARARIDELDRCLNRRHRRQIVSKHRRNPLSTAETFERIPE